MQEMSGKEKDMLEKEAKEKVAKRSTCLEKVRQIQITDTNTNGDSKNLILVYQAKELRTQLKL